MPSFKNLEMAAAVSAHQDITIKKTLFGLSEKAVYTPTQSPLKVSIREYVPTEGERLERLLNLPMEKMASELQAKGAPNPSDIGHYRLETCLSEDHQFAALQLFRFVDFRQTPLTEPRFYTGGDVETIAKL